MTTSTTRTHKVRHWLLGLSLVAGPTFITVSAALNRAVDWEDSEAVVAFAAANPGRWQLTSLIGFFGFALLVPAAIAAAELVRARHPALGLTSTIMISAGAVMICAAIIADFTLAAANPDEVAVLAAVHARVEDLPGVTAMFPLFFSALFGILLLAFSLWRARAVPIWAPILMAVSMVGVFFGPTGPVELVFQAALMVSFLAVAWAYLRRSDEPSEIDLTERVVAPPPTVEAP